MKSTQTLQDLELPNIGDICGNVKHQMLYNRRMNTKKDSSKTDANWGMRVRALRNRRGLSRFRVEEGSQVSQDAINRIERGDVRNPRDDKRVRLAEFFGVSEGYLLTGKPHIDGDPEYDILEDPLVGSVEIKPKAPYSKSIKLSEPKENEDRAAELMRRAQKATDTIKKTIFQGELEPAKVIQIYGVIYSAISDEQDS